MRGWTPVWRVEIDQLSGLARGEDSGFDHRGRRAGDRDDRTVVVCILRPIQQRNARHLHSPDNGEPRSRRRLRRSSERTR